MTQKQNKIDQILKLTKIFLQDINSDTLEIKNIYQKHYQGSSFVRIKQDLPKLRDVVDTNFCDIGFALNLSDKEAVLVSCIDNLIKGAAGAAVQSMNIMLGWDETVGLL